MYIIWPCTLLCIDLYIYIYISICIIICKLSNDVLHLVFQLVPYQFLWGSLIWAPQQKLAEGNIKNLYPKDAEFAGAAPGWQLGAQPGVLF